jgi:hypothetical protein
MTSRLCVHDSPFAPLRSGWDSSWQKKHPDKSIQVVLTFITVGKIDPLVK